ncbi:RNA polymerase sigma factor [Patescibacteria group bacterium]|nr:RNA polymerase sigma factor [Patescibacteria group bacterium]
MHFSNEFQTIYIRYSDKIYRYLYIQTRDPYLAEDITSETFLRAWKKWREIKQDYIQALLFKIARNILIDYWRREKDKKKISLELTTEMGIEPSYDEDLIEKIHKDEKVKGLNVALGKLAKNLREVVILRFMEELSAREAAGVIGTTEGNIRILQFRALRKLKEFLNEK